MQSFTMALRSISANKMRAVLTMLGIIIGVMALVVLVSLVNGATSSVTSEMVTLKYRNDDGTDSEICVVTLNVVENLHMETFVSSTN